MAVLSDIKLKLEQGPLSPPAPPTMTPSECVDEWVKTQNFNEGTFQSPAGPIVQLNGSSWGQVPYILKRALAENVKIDFVCSGDDQAKAEMAEIRVFLQQLHKIGLPKALADLEQKLTKFDPSQVPPPGTIKDAKAWIAAHGLTAPAESTFVVTDILVAPKSGASADLDKFKEDSRAALQEHQRSKRPLAVLLPEAAAVQTAVAATLSELLKNAPHLQSVEKTALVWRPGASDPSKLLEESLADFLGAQAQAAVPSATTITVLPPESLASGQEPSKPPADDHSDDGSIMLSQLAEPTDRPPAETVTTKSDPPPAPSSEELENQPPSTTQKVRLRSDKLRQGTADEVLLCYPCHSYTQPGHSKKLGVGNQDRMGIRVAEKGVFLAVSDGCSKSWNSAVGASLLTTWALAATEKIFQEHQDIPSPEQFAELLEGQLLKKMQRDIAEYSQDEELRDVRLEMTFAATILIGVITPTWSAVIGAGDGCYSFGGDKIETIKNRYKEHPEYLHYRLLHHQEPEMPNVKLKVFAKMNTTDISSLALFSDGAMPLLEIDKEATLAQVVNDKRFVQPDQRDKLFAGTFQPLAKELDDDFTVVVAQRDALQLPAVWQQFRSGDASAFRPKPRKKRSRS